MSPTSQPPPSVASHQPTRSPRSLPPLHAHPPPPAQAGRRRLSEAPCGADSGRFPPPRAAAAGAAAAAAAGSGSSSASATVATCLVGLPRWHCDTRAAKRSVHSDSCAEAGAGESAMSTSALPPPLRHGCRRCVSLELRKGTCAARALMAEKTSASADSDLLMACVSLSRSPVACDLSPPPAQQRHRAPGRPQQWRCVCSLVQPLNLPNPSQFSNPNPA